MFCIIRPANNSSGMFSSSNSIKVLMRLLFIPALFVVFLCVFTISTTANVHVVRIREEKEAEWKAARRAICELPLAVGNCTRKFTRFYWDLPRGHCYKFVYTGCGGNANRFLSRHQCKRRCSPKHRHRKTKISARLSISRHRELERERQKACQRNCSNRVCIRGQCQCRKGFELVGTGCIDSNECHWAKCVDGAKCVNLAGSFRCECRPGFAGSGFSCSRQRSICGQPFDRRYEQQCHFGDGLLHEWEPRWFFHLRSGKCLPFWHGGCQFGESLNFFPDQQSCEAICDGYSHEQFLADEFGVQANNMPMESGRQTNDRRLQGNTSAVACLDNFDDSLRLPCSDGIWKRRYFYDARAKRCQVFWMDVSCARPVKGLQRSANASGSRNIFAHLANCKRSCEPNPGEDWAVEKWPENLRSAEAAGSMGVIQASFWRNRSDARGHGKQQAGNGAFKDDCQEVVLADALLMVKSAKEKKERMARLKAKLRAQKVVGSTAESECLDKFDWNLTKSCGRLPWVVRFFFDARLAKCRPFWTDGCEGRTRNQFVDEKSCQRACERSRQRIPNDGENLTEKMEKSQANACLEPFDDNYRRACNNGKFWRRKWFFDQMNGFCRHFWFDGCKGRSMNIFDGLKECMDECLQGNDLPKSEEVGAKREFAYFASGEAEDAGEGSKTDFWAFRNDYLQSEQMLLDATQCTGFRFNATGDARLNAFFCLLEHGGGCQLTIMTISNGSEQCHSSRPWLKEKHSYAWFFTLGRRPRDDYKFQGSIAPGHGVLSLTQRNLNLTSSIVVKMAPFTAKNETATAWVELIEIAEKCHQIC